MSDSVLLRQLALGTLLLGGAMLLWLQLGDPVPAQAPQTGILLAPQLRGADGHPLDGAWLNGHWTLLTFGYTHCPDICPTTLSLLHQTLETLATTGKQQLQVLFVSLDPARDSDQRLRSYLAYFGSKFHGASATHGKLRAFTDTLGALYQLQPPDEYGDYSVNHSATVFLIAPDRTLAERFYPPQQATAMARRISQLQQQYSARDARAG